MNVVINSAETKEMLQSLFYSDSMNYEAWKVKEPVHNSKAEDVQTLMVELGIYSSKSQAMRDGRSGPIPKGFTENYKASKKHRLTIWNPLQLNSIMLK